MIGGVISLSGGLLLLQLASARKAVIRYALAFGAGALLGAAFLSALPEALHGVDEPVTVLAWALGGFLVFFLLERLLGWFHHHHHDDINAAAAKRRSHSYLVIVGDTLHNAIDGVAIGAAFLVNPTLGITTSIAVAAHEIPQEIGDFGILLGKGMRPRRVVLVNMLCALATVVSAVTVYLLGSTIAIDPAPLLALAAGFFIYIAASDIVPEIHEKPRKQANRQTALLLVGVAMIALVTFALPHSHEASDVHDHEVESSATVDDHASHDHNGHDR